MTPETFAAWDGTGELPGLLDVDVVYEVDRLGSIAAFRFAEGTAFEVLSYIGPVGWAMLALHEGGSRVEGARRHGDVTVIIGPTGERAWRSAHWRPAEYLTADAILWNRTAKGADERHTADAERQSV